MLLPKNSLDKHYQSPEIEALRDRLFRWDSPSQEQLREIGLIEFLWGRLLDSILENCPPNREQEQAIIHLESVREWARKSIIRESQSN
ncbi:MAG TPA: hypothetical protein DCY91_08960 [Cyanobacteria bacterium UBA11370]|nr:hypothetical protein [Cyanobacteria bacterium UBA11370]HBY79782.1 hypothetical protein [Cyanobacteria bacterium UBA11148]